MQVSRGSQETGPFPGWGQAPSQDGDRPPPLSQAAHKVWATKPSAPLNPGRPQGSVGPVHGSVYGLTTWAGAAPGPPIPGAHARMGVGAEGQELRVIKSLRTFFL